MDLDRLIEVAFARTPTSAEIEEAANSERIPMEEALDRFARRVAERYLDGVYSFGDSDMAMNNLFAWSTAVTGSGLPEFAWKVFGAFDAGEFTRPGVPEDQQGELLTRRLLSGWLGLEPRVMGPMACPSFEEVTRRFQNFLRENGWPTEIVWVKTDENLERLASAEAKREFEFARQRGLGVCLCALRVTGGSSLAVVEYPRDSDEAERLMYPSDGGLKLSVAVKRDV
jgi:hypothetical protein